MKEKDREIQIGENRLYLDEDNILYIIINGDTDEKVANAIKDATFRLFNLVEGKVNAIIDLNNAGKQSAEARNIGKETFEHGKNNKLAIFGTHPVAKVIASFVMGVTKKKDMRFFKNKEDALEWLKEEF
jgi:hypothetical protein